MFSLDFISQVLYNTHILKGTKMGDFKDNPTKPFEVPVPNKIRKRIAMHEKHKPKLVVLGKQKWSYAEPSPPKKRGSMWSR